MSVGAIVGSMASRAIMGPAASSWRPRAPFVVEEILPGPAVESDEALKADIRARGVSNLHPVGTCRMGRDGDSVVDPQLRVRGVDGLRVVDASVMPELPGGNTNAPTIVIAEKASELILAEGA